MNKFRIIVRTSILLVLAFFVFKSMYIFTVNKQYINHKDTGTIISKSYDEVAIKHGTSTELYLNVQFDKSGFRAMEVGPTTYFKFKKCQRITFDLRDSTEEGNSIYFIMGLMCYVIIGFFSFIFLITWAFNLDWKI